MRTRLFNDARITVQNPEPEDPAYRDLLVEVKERNTGSANFGVAVGSDQGVFGELSLSQNNFDITDFPESLQELLSGRAFRGAGQRFNAVLRPGTEIFQYSMSVTEPHLFDSLYSLTVGGQFRDRFYDRYDETRFGGNIRLGRQFGDIWAVALQGRAEEVELTDIDPFAPTEVFQDAGPNTLTSVGLSVTRSTVSTIIRPGKGSRLETSYDRYGALGGDFDFDMVNAEYSIFFTLDEDFLGRLTTLRLNSRMGYIWGDRPPVYEQFYLGGRSLRGFDFRTVSPKGIRADNGEPSDDAVGGEWLVFFGAQYELPIFGDAMTGVAFVDSGTVLDDPGFEDYRVAAGVGIRLYIPQFGDVPIAFDFAFPLKKEDTDEEQLFSFMVDFPF
jgi:outer membrane protein insertion porin family